MVFLSRRGSLGFALCACAAPAAFATETLPDNYTPPHRDPEPGLAPGLRTQMVSGRRKESPRTWIVTLGEGDEVMSGLTEWMTREVVEGAYLTGIGGFSSALFGWFDQEKKAFLNIPVHEQVECVSLIGNVGMVGDYPELHVHGSVARRDGTMKGGHLLSAIASPTLEVFATEISTPLRKAKDPKTSLEMFQLDR